MKLPSSTNLGEEDVTASNLGHRNLVEAELVASNAWLIRVRWMAGIGVLFSTWIVQNILNLQAPFAILYSIGASILLYNLIFYIVEQRLTRSTAPSPSFARQAMWQVGLDWLAMTLLIHYSGGIESPAIFYFIFHIIIASIFFAPRIAFGFALLACGLVTGISLLEYLGILPHEAIHGYLEQPLYQNNLYLVGVLIFFSSSGLIAAYLASTIIERLRQREEEVVTLSERLQRATKRLQAVNESARIVGSTLDLSQVLNRLVQTTAEAMGVQACSIRLIDKTGQRLEPVAIYGLSQEYLNKGPVDAIINPLAREVLSGKTVNIPDAPSSPLIQYPEEAQKEGIRSMLSAPLIGKSGPLGILRSYALEPNRFIGDDEQFLAAIAAQGSIAIDNALAYQAIEELDSAKSQFVRIVTHELRSPVSVALSLLRTMQGGYAGEVSGQQQELISRALRRLEFLHKLIDDLLDLAAGKTEVKPDEEFELIELGEVLHQVVRRYEVSAQEKGIKIDLHCTTGAEGMHVKATREGLDRTLNNLLSNAVKYTLPGGLVSVTLTEINSEAQVIIEDTGIGIPEESLGHLFEEFYRAPNAKALENEGTGLGLTIVKDTLIRFGGRITVTSKLNEGSTFTLFLPLETLHGNKPGR